MKQTLIIMGSARNTGNTALAADRIKRAAGRPFTRIDLCTLTINPFRYGLSGSEDDFPRVVAQMVQHQQIVFATPVYWYAMSGLMKTMFDRLTDLLLTPEGKKTGRSLADKQVWVLATGTDEHLPPGFHEPFALTADYFDMQWQHAFYIRVNSNLTPTEQDFGAAERLAAALG